MNTTDYTDKDFASLRERLFALVASVFPEWTDRNVANFGTVLLELYAFVGDVLVFYQDRQAAESRFGTASQRKSLIALSKFLGFAPSGATAATADVTVTLLGGPSPGDVVLPAGTPLATADVTSPAEFQLLDPVTIAAGLTTGQGAAENSTAALDTFASSGLPNQEFTLAQAPYLDASAIVGAADGYYVQVDNFLASTSTSRHYTVTVDQNDRARIRFGNGVAGAIPVYTIRVDYKTGGGALGNVPAGAIRVLEGAFTDVLGNPVQLGVENALKASGGTDRMSNAAIRVRAPASLRAPVNSVTREDFEINALRLSQVARALMVDNDMDPAVPENTGSLYVIPVGGGVPSWELKTTVLSIFMPQGTEPLGSLVYPAPLTFIVNVFDPLYRTVDVEARVYRRAGFSPATVRANVETALRAWFAIENEDGSPNPNVDFGAKYVNADGASDPRLPWSDLFNVVRDAAGVRRVDPSAVGFLLNGERADVALLNAEFPQLGAVTLIDGDTGGAF